MKLTLNGLVITFENYQQKKVGRRIIKIDQISLPTSSDDKSHNLKCKSVIPTSFIKKEGNMIYANANKQHLIF